MTSLEFLVSKFGTVDGDKLWRLANNKAGDVADYIDVRKLVTELMNLQAGYAAARLEIESLRASHKQAPAQPAPHLQGATTDEVDVPYQCPYFGPSPHRDVWLAGWYACKVREAKNTQCAELAELLKEARKIIRASSSRQLAKDWDRRATQALRDEGHA